MAVIYLDTSALVKYYVNEPGSKWLRQTVDFAQNSNVVCEICLPEFVAALSRLHREGRFGQRFVQTAYVRLLADLRQRVFLAHAVDRRTLDLAAALAIQYPLKAYDAVQLAACILVQRQLQSPVTFVCADRQALSAAALEGLSVDNPLLHREEEPQP